MNLILSESRYLRYFSFTILYVAQGFAVRSRDGGIARVPARARREPRGRRRVRRRRDAAVDLQMAGGSDDGPVHVSRDGAQATVGIVRAAGSCADRSRVRVLSGRADDLVALTALCFVLNCFGAAQDVAVDGMAMDVLPEDEHGRANAFMGFGQVAGHLRVRRDRRLRAAIVRPARHLGDAGRRLWLDPAVGRARARARGREGAAVDAGAGHGTLAAVARGVVGNHCGRSRESLVLAGEPAVDLRVLAVPLLRCVVDPGGTNRRRAAARGSEHRLFVVDLGHELHRRAGRHWARVVHRPARGEALLLGGATRVRRSRHRGGLQRVCLGVVGVF